MLTPAYVDRFPDLAIRILSYLSLPDILACLRTHIALYKLIKDSVVLQYHINTQLAGVEDNPCSTIAVHERLDRLNSRETGWAQHDFDFSWVVKVPSDCSWIYGLTSGVILLAGRSRQLIHYSMLPSSPSDKMMWRQINVGANIVSMGLATYEHNLIAVVTTTSQDNVQNIEIALLELSTGAPHPQARRPRLFVTESQWTHPCISISIAGDTLTLIITYHNDPMPPIPEDNFYIFDWKAGVLKMHTTAPGNSYTSLLFLTPTLLVLPNAITGTLEFWDPAFTHPIGALGLPPLSDGWVFKPITCRCDPEPRASGTPHSPHPFHTSPTDALALFNIRLESIHGIEAFSMFVHRDALLRLRPSPPSDDTSMATFAVIPWDTWGPHMARWMIGESSLWDMNTAGERAVIAGPRPGTHVVVDFRPWRLREGRGRREKKALHTLIVDRPGEMTHPAFAAKVNLGLPYVRRTLTGIQPYDGLLMDEERLIGLKMDESGSRLKEFVIHHIGARPPRKTDVDGTMQRLRKLIGRGLNWLG